MSHLTQNSTASNKKHHLTILPKIGEGGKSIIIGSKLEPTEIIKEEDEAIFRTAYNNKNLATVLNMLKSNLSTTEVYVKLPIEDLLALIGYPVITKEVN